MKICTNCKQDKELCEFNKKTSKKDGLQNICRVCSNTKSKKYYQANPKKHIENTAKNTKKYVKKINEIIELVKLKHGCALCNENDPCCIDFHHLKEKKIAISKVAYVSGSVKFLLEEMKKCVCVCANCHRKIHKGKLQVDKSHLVDLNGIGD